MSRGAPVHSQALVLDCTKLKETDKIVTLLLKNGSLLGAVAKGSRRPGSRLSAPTELYSLSDVLIAPGKSLSVLADAKRLKSFSTQGTQDRPIEVIAAMAAFAQALVRAFPEGEKAPYLFGLAQATFQTLQASHEHTRTLLVSTAAILKLLSYLGWKPELALCVECGNQGVTHLSVSLGGALCDACQNTAPDAQGASPRMIAWLQALLKLRLQDLARAPIDDAMARSLGLFTKRWASYHLDTPLKAFDFLLAL